MINTKTRKQNLLLGSGLVAMAAIALPTLAIAQATEPSVTTSSEASIGVVQDYNAYNAATPATDSITLDGNTSGSVNITADDNDDTTNSVVDSTLTIGTSATTRNVASASGYANDATLTVVTQLNNATGTGTADVDASADFSTATTLADVSIGLAQTNTLTIATVGQDVSMGITVDGTTNSSLQVSSNVQEAIGVLNNGTTTLNSTANNSSGSAGIASAQTSEMSDLAVTTTSVDSITVGTGDGLDAVDFSTLALTGNSQRAVAVGNEGSNSQTVAGNDLTVATISALAPGGSYAGLGSEESLATYATASSQAIDGGVELGTTISANNTGGYAVSVDSNVNGSTVKNDSNTVSSVVRGNEVSNVITAGSSTSPLNSISESAADLTTGTATATVAAISSDQDVAWYDISANTFALTGTGVTNTVTGSVTNSSSMTASGNTLAADAMGNRGTNGISAYATTINTTGDTVTSANVDGTNSTATAAFAVASSQSVDEFSTISADATLASVSTQVGVDINGSTVASNLNLISASATGNLITAGSNSVVVGGTNVATTAAVANSQTMDGNVTVSIGDSSFAPSSPATADTPAVVTTYQVGDIIITADTTVDGNWNNGANSFDPGATVTVTGASLTAGQKAYLVDLGFSLSGTDYVYSIAGMTQADVNTMLGTSFTNGQFTSGHTTVSAMTITSTSIYDIETSPLIPGSPATLGSIGTGVTIAVGESILDSSVAVNGNAIEGAVTGNSAANRVSMSATNLDQGATDTDVAVTDPAAASGNNATANAALTNDQMVGAGTLDATVTGTFGIYTASAGDGSVGGSDIDNSSVSVSSNSLSASSTGNTASNGLSLTGANITTNGGLLSNQSSDSDVSATGNMLVTAPAANSDSTLKLDSNSNAATAVINTASNTVRVAADNSLNSTSASADAILGSAVGTADFVLNNVQGATTTAAATANTVITNFDSGFFDLVNGVATPTDGVLNSSVSATGNTTAAAASANRSTNNLIMSANSATASGGVYNQQDSTASVDATANTAVVMLVEATGTPSAIENSSTLIANNATSARAGGNTASNSLTAAATSFDVNGADDADVSVSSIGATVTESFAVLNQQSNSGPITAVANVTYGAGFASAAAADVLNSSVALNGNSAAANAYGNSASNGLTLTALNLGSTQAAIGNQQLNTGNVSASVASASAGSLYGIQTDATANNGTVSSSQLSISRSTTSAVATGNSNTSVLTITANAANYAGPNGN